jgi:hypothetical protein
MEWLVQACDSQALTKPCPNPNSLHYYSSQYLLAQRIAQNTRLSMILTKKSASSYTPLLHSPCMSTPNHGPIDLSAIKPTLLELRCG